MTARCGHAAEARESASAQEVEDDTFDEVVGGVCDRDHLRACLAAGAIEECVANVARSSLHRTLRQRCGASLGDERHSKPPAQRCDLLRDTFRARAQSVVVMCRHNFESTLVQSHEQRCRVRTA
jgi:hypothetical protein